PPSRGPCRGSRSFPPISRAWNVRTTTRSELRSRCRNGANNGCCGAPHATRAALRAERRRCLASSTAEIDRGGVAAADKNADALAARGLVTLGQRRRESRGAPGLRPDPQLLPQGVLPGP